ncbi:unnamed protein product [Cuscuta europaea]|uniref:Uncharacterized protein n=1 Tax=Cuscuta europaea TaxID=41803 RepID=A0A9P0YKP0_CUSEU|nr:unnamed protein product [Cuscuta europaea]
MDEPDRESGTTVLWSPFVLHKAAVVILDQGWTSPTEDQARRCYGARSCCIRAAVVILDQGWTSLTENQARRCCGARSCCIRAAVVILDQGWTSPTENQARRCCGARSCCIKSGPCRDMDLRCHGHCHGPYIAIVERNGPDSTRPDLDIHGLNSTQLDKHGLNSTRLDKHGLDSTRLDKHGLDWPSSNPIVPMIQATHTKDRKQFLMIWRRLAVFSLYLPRSGIIQ